MENKKKYIIISSIGVVVVALAMVVSLVVLKDKESKIDIGSLNKLVNEKYKITNSIIEERVLNLDIESNNLDTDSLRELGNTNSPFLSLMTSYLNGTILPFIYP